MADRTLIPKRISKVYYRVRQLEMKLLTGVNDDEKVDAALRRVAAYVRMETLKFTGDKR